MSHLFKSTLEPLNAKGAVIGRGKSIVGIKDDLGKKFAAARLRAPGLVAIDLVDASGNKTHYTLEQITDLIANGVKGKVVTTPTPESPKQEVITKIREDLTKLSTKWGTLTPEATESIPVSTTKKSKTKKVATAAVTTPKKVGVIEEIANTLTGAQDKGVGIKDIVATLVKKFPERDAKAMEITVRCQLGRLGKTRNLKITRIKEGKVSLYKAVAA